MYGRLGEGVSGTELGSVHSNALPFHGSCG